MHASEGVCHESARRFQSHRAHGRHHDPHGWSAWPRGHDRGRDPDDRRRWAAHARGVGRAVAVRSVATWKLRRAFERKQLHARHRRGLGGRFGADVGVRHGARDIPDSPWSTYPDLPLRTPMLNQRTTSGSRRGASILELMITLTIFGLVMAGVTSAIVEQTRFQAGASRVVGSQRSMRQIGDLLPSELRALGTGAGDIYAMGPSSVDLRVTTGSSVVCSISAGRTSVTIPPVQLATAVPLTSWRDVPLAGDSVFIFDEGALSARNDDTWRAYRLTASANVAGTCATATGFTRTAGEAAAGKTVAVTPAISATT